MVLRASRAEYGLWGWPLGLLLLLCVVWELTINFGSVSTALLPRPSELAQFMATHLGALIGDALVTARQACVSLVLAGAFGMAVGSLIFASTLARETFYPLLVVLQIVPKVATAPLFVMWLGTGDAARIGFGVFLSFFPVLLATLTGLEQVDTTAQRLCASLGATPFQTFWMVRTPYALPHVFAGLKIAATLAVTGVVIGEFMSADRGLGFLIIGAAARVDSKSLFAAIVMLCVIGLAMFGAVVVAQRVFRLWYAGR